MPTKSEPLAERIALVRKVLELERRKGFADRAVLGGLEAFVAQQLPAERAYVAGYQHLGTPERRQAVARLEERLDALEGRPRVDLRAWPIRHLAGVGPKRAEQLEKLGLRTVEDLLTFLPRRLEDRSQRKPIAQLRDGDVGLVQGVVRVKARSLVRPKLELIKVAVDDGTGILYAIWFNQPWIWDQIVQGETYAFFGRVQQRFRELQMENPVWERAGENKLTGRLVPVYPSTEGLSQPVLQNLIRRALKQFGPHIGDAVPAEVRERLNLLPRREAIAKVHFPRGPEEFEQARRTLAFEEFLLLQIGLLRRRKEQARAGRALNPDPRLLQRFLSKLPFPLTPSQQRALEAIERDLRAPYPMLRLLQGDVGSGKTVVAAGACVLTASADAQAAVMVPTEILAEQHYFVLSELVEHLPLRVERLVGGMPKRERKKVLEGVQSGEVHVVVGTHALIQEGVEFKDLGLAVIDEQHRFGVIQRALLEKKGQGTNVLIMSATPIPRTIVLTLYGEFAVSVLEEMPAPRGEVHTVWLREAGRERAYQEVERRLGQGEKGYVIFPLVEESEDVDLRAATQGYEELRARFDAFGVALLHGRMPIEKKREAMRRFRSGEVRLLVATTVVEVGLDVPDASFVVIEHADRFGLAQLHQIRGRIGRRGQPAWCCAIADPTTEEAHERLTAFVQHGDGFTIAEEDLRIRGPGDLLGTEQSGFISQFRAADLVRDVALLEKARSEAARLVRSGLPERLAQEAERRYGAALDLLGV